MFNSFLDRTVVMSELSRMRSQAPRVVDVQVTEFGQCRRNYKYILRNIRTMILNLTRFQDVGATFLRDTGSIFRAASLDCELNSRLEEKVA